MTKYRYSILIKVVTRKKDLLRFFFSSKVKIFCSDFCNMIIYIYIKYFRYSLSSTISYRNISWIICAVHRCRTAKAACPRRPRPVALAFKKGLLSRPWIKESHGQLTLEEVKWLYSLASEAGFNIHFFYFPTLQNLLHTAKFTKEFYAYGLSSLKNDGHNSGIFFRFYPDFLLFIIR